MWMARSPKTDGLQWKIKWNWMNWELEEPVIMIMGCSWDIKLGCESDIDGVLGMWMECLLGMGIRYLKTSMICGGFLKWGSPNIDGLQWKIPIKTGWFGIFICSNLSLGKAGPFTLENHIPFENLKMQSSPFHGILMDSWNISVILMWRLFGDLNIHGMYFS